MSWKLNGMHTFAKTTFLWYDSDLVVTVMLLSQKTEYIENDILVSYQSHKADGLYFFVPSRNYLKYRQVSSYQEYFALR